MKIVAILFGLAATANAKLIPAGAQAEKMRQASGSAKIDKFDDITPACNQIGCADIQCLPPFQLQRRKGQCCPICWAPDHLVGIDRHTALEGGSPHAVDPAPAAPSSCAGVKCFQPVCMPGQEVGHRPGACCHGCK